MTDKEFLYWQLLVAFVIGLLAGLIIGATVTESRIGSEIRTDQLELKKDVAEVIEDETIIEDIVKTLLFQTEQLKLERQRLRKLQEKLSDGE